MEKLANERDPVEIYRVQGRIELLNEILELPGEADKYIRGVSNGTMNKIKTEEKQNGRIQ